MNEQLITIIVPIYNAEKYIKRCIESILNQTYKNLEVILINDGSTDQSKTLCEDYAKIDTRIKVINKKNEGVSKARNTGLDIANGKYILFADSDDWLEDTMIEKMYGNAMKHKSDIVICEYNHYIENDDRIEYIKLGDMPQSTFPELITDDSTKYGGFPWNKLIKREIIRHNFNEEVHYYENLLFFLENANYDLNYSVVHEPLYNYCINDTSAVHSKKYSIKKISSLKALEIIIPLVPDINQIMHKYVFISVYYENLYNIKNEKLKNTEITIYKARAKQYYKEIKKSRELNLKKKIKLFILFYMPLMYFILKKIKR